MEHNLHEDSLWAGGEYDHIKALITNGKKKIESLMAKIKQTDNHEEKEKLNAEIEKIKLEVETQLRNTQENLY